MYASESGVSVRTGANLGACEAKPLERVLNLEPPVEKVEAWLGSRHAWSPGVSLCLTSKRVLRGEDRPKPTPAVEGLVDVEPVTSLGLYIVDGGASGMVILNLSVWEAIEAEAVRRTAALANAEGAGAPEGRGTGSLSPLSKMVLRGLLDMVHPLRLWLGRLVEVLCAG